MMMKVDWNCPKYRITCHWLLFKRLNITRYVLLYIAWMTVVGDTPDIDFRYMRVFFILSLAYGIKMIECVVQISLHLLIKVSKIHINNSNWTSISIIFWHSYIVYMLYSSNVLSVPSWSWSHGSWIHNYLCNQCPSCEFELRSWWGVLDTTLCDKICEWLATGRWFSPVSSTNETDRHDITEILLKVAINTITLTLYCSRSDVIMNLNLILNAKYNRWFPVVVRFQNK
jgi:hypothetical protein